jgi:hypothetical protein
VVNSPTDLDRRLLERVEHPLILTGGSPCPRSHRAIG